MNRANDKRPILLVLFNITLLAWIIAAIIIHAAYGQVTDSTDGRMTISMFIGYKNPVIPPVVQEAIAEEIIIQCRLANIPWEIVTAIISA